MIVSAEKKIAIFLVPKTGTTTICHMFKELNVPLYYCNHEHMNYISAKYFFRDLDLKEFKFYAFYRNPIHRFRSVFLNSERLNLQRKRFDFDEVFEYYREKLFLYSQNKNYANDFNVLDHESPLATLREFMKPQVHWLDHDLDLTLLSFENFNDNVKKIFSLFIDNTENLNIPKLFKTEKVIDFSEPQSNKIKDLYKIDYDFFESKGIKFI